MCSHQGTRIPRAVGWTFRSASVAGRPIIASLSEPCVETLEAAALVRNQPSEIKIHNRFAAGDGRNTAKLASLAKQLYVVDANPEAVQFLRERFSDHDQTRCSLQVIHNNREDLRDVPSNAISLLYSFDSMIRGVDPRGRCASISCRAVHFEKGLVESVYGGVPAGDGPSRLRVCAPFQFWARLAGSVYDEPHPWPAAPRSDAISRKRSGPFSSERRLMNPTTKRPSLFNLGSPVLQSSLGCGEYELRSTPFGIIEICSSLSPRTGVRTSYGTSRKRTDPVSDRCATTERKAPPSQRNAILADGDVWNRRN